MEQTISGVGRTKRLGIKILSAAGFFALGGLSPGFAPADCLPLSIALFAAAPAKSAFFALLGFLLSVSLGFGRLSVGSALLPVLFLLLRWALYPVKKTWDKPLLPALCAFLLPVFLQLLFVPVRPAALLIAFCQGILLAGGSLLAVFLRRGDRLPRKELLSLFFLLFLMAAARLQPGGLPLAGLLCFLLLLLTCEKRNSCLFYGLFSTLAFLWAGREFLPQALAFLLSGILLPFSAAQGKAARFALLFLLFLASTAAFLSPLTLLCWSFLWGLSVLLSLIPALSRLDPYLSALVWIPAQPRGRQRQKPPAPQQTPLALLLSTSEKVCRRCRNKELCWCKEYSATMDAFVHAADGGCPAYFYDRCPRTELLFAPLVKAEPVHWQVTGGSRAKAGESCCGDLLSDFTVGGSRFLLLSDGMGSGKQAEQDAHWISFLIQERLCRGESPADCLRRGEALWLEQTGGERPVALDLLLLQADGRFVLYKMGGAASFLISAAGTKQLCSACPPLGALENSKPTCFRRTLQKDEVLLLRSDGLLLSEETLSALLTKPPAHWKALLFSAAPEQTDDSSFFAITADR